MHILVAGGHGFIGRALKQFLEFKGHQVTLLSRKPNTQEPFWNPEKDLLDLSLIEAADAVINLCGENIMGLWTEGKARRFKRSRLMPAALLVSKIEQAIQKPKVYISASAVGIYAAAGDEIIDEDSALGSDYFATLCHEWEVVADPLISFGVRSVFLRLGVVLDKNGGALKSMLPAFRCGLGGKLGDGRQWMSWIELSDVLNVFELALENQQVYGALNCVAPQPVRNHIFTKSLGQILHVPTQFTIPKWLLKLIFGKAAPLFLESQKVVPKKLIEQYHFHFQYPEIVGALRASCRRDREDASLL